MTLLLTSPEKRAGRVFTPDSIAEALCSWAIRAPTDTVLDLGVGEGAFLLAAGRQLRELGSPPDRIAESIHGAERDSAVYARAVAAVREQLDISLEHVVREDFYESRLPVADAIVGNPPYIRRHYQEDPSSQRLMAGNPLADGMTDAYCYFLLRACAVLAPRGRLAVVISSSWLDMRYGEQLKRVLLAQGMRIRLVLGFGGRVFSDVLVKPVVLLAERADDGETVPFARLDRDFDLATLPGAIDRLCAGEPLPGAELVVVHRAELEPEAPWSVYLKAPGVYSKLLAHGTWTPLRGLADSRIGLQSFAKAFYVLTREEAIRRGIESEFLLPLAFSPRDVRTPVLGDGDATRHVVFACDRPIHELRGTRAAWHIRMGMQATVQVRGTDAAVRGFHQAPRLRRAGREPWYDIRTEITRRGAWPILLPRRAFRTLMVIHNRAGAVANEDFLEIRPRQVSHVEPLLAVLNTSVGELLLRTQSFQYGGGVFNLNPGVLRSLPVPNLTVLTEGQLRVLSNAWRSFAMDEPGGGARTCLDQAVADVLSLPPRLCQEVEGALAELVRSTGDAALAQGSFASRTPLLA